MPPALQEIKDWIIKRHPEVNDIPADLDLIETRLIDSLTFVELVFLVEQLSGQTIDMEGIDADDFRTLAAIESHFLAPVA